MSSSVTKHNNFMNGSNQGSFPGQTPFTPNPDIKSKQMNGYFPPPVGLRPKALKPLQTGNPIDEDYPSYGNNMNGKLTS
jgi:hypothetical protein